MNVIPIDGLIILPNPFPYFYKQFLITTENLENKPHKTQRIFQNDFSYFLKVLKVANELCKQKDGIVFFNGICGNSLEHFHCQFAQQKLPIFDFIDNKDGSEDNLLTVEKGVQVLYNTKDNNQFFRGVVFSNFSMDNLSKKVEIYVNELTKRGYLYNFIIRKKGSRLQMVLFIRNCKVKKGTIDFNFGSTELGGISVKSERYYDTIGEKDIVKYLDETNSVWDIYKVISAIL